MDATEALAIRFKYTALDFVDAFRLYEDTILMGKVVKVAAIVTLANACLAAYAYVMLAQMDEQTMQTEWFAVLLFVLALVLWFNPLGAWQAWLHFTTNSKIYTDQTEVTFDGVGVHAKTSTSDIKRPWAAYTTVLESKRVFVLVYGKWLFATTPKRAFSDEKQMQAFREMLIRRIGKFG